MDTRREWYQIGYRDGENETINKNLKEASDKILDVVKQEHLKTNPGAISSIEEILNAILKNWRHNG